MALIRCPECGNQISDESKVCIHCGYPLDLNTKEEQKEIILDRASGDFVEPIIWLVLLHVLTVPFLLYAIYIGWPLNLFFFIFDGLVELIGLIVVIFLIIEVVQNNNRLCFPLIQYNHDKGEFILTNSKGKERIVSLENFVSVRGKKHISVYYHQGRKEKIMILGYIRKQDKDFALSKIQKITMR